MEQQTKLNNASKPKLILLGLLLVVVIPLLAAQLLYNFRDYFAINSLNNGELLKPPIPLKNLFPAQTHNLELRSDNFKGQWQLIYIMPNPCEESCQKNRLTLNNIHLALGKNQRKLLVRFIARTDTSKKKENIENSLSDKSLDQELNLGAIWLIDPKGFLMMHYSENNLNAKGILADLRRLIGRAHAR